MINLHHGFRLGCAIVKLYWNELFVEGNREVGEARREKSDPSAAISVVADSGRVSLNSADLNGGYRLLASCHNPIIGR